MFFFLSPLAFMCVFLSWLPKAQLWRLEVACWEDSSPWSQEWSDEGELAAARPRQLDGIDAIRSQTGRWNVSTKDYASLSFWL